MSRSRRGAPVILWSLLAVMPLAGCADGDAAERDPASAPSRDAATPGDRAGPRSLPAPCTVIDAADLSLYVALDDWRSAGSTDHARSACRFEGRGFTVTTVAVLLPGPGELPDGLCAPPGSQPLPVTEEAACRYTGPGEDSATAVITAGRVAFGVRVDGPDALNRADTLAAHASTHF